ncbi:hypothetical protein WUBG_01827 [Wuchereria bancrofti]|uniref:Uncharacterized protein n=1 Tax=Wuchereria bancrofti TaxID=6293 RepID=J9EYF3_WUCBA|nr:hypothetical protein WUBG_01827 [Wuchereria bancrofti]
MAACFLKDFVERYTLLRTSWWLKRPMRNRQVQLQQKVSLSVLAAAVLRTFSSRDTFYVSSEGGNSAVGRCLYILRFKA